MPSKRVNKNRTESLIMTPGQCRMACSGLEWNWDDLAQAAEVSRDTIARFLRGEDLRPGTIASMQSALETAGVEFIAENGGGPGVRLAKKSKTKG
jgi:hypothetical protein